MAWLHNSCAKLCVTCQYWVGARVPNQWCTGVFTETQGIKGKCWCLNGPHARADRLSTFCACSRYEKWSVLK